MARLRRVVEGAPSPVYLIRDPTSVPRARNDASALVVESRQARFPVVGPGASPLDALRRSSDASLRIVAVDEADARSELTVPQFADALRVSVGTVEELLAAGSVVAIDDADGAMSMPAFQLVGEPPTLSPAVARVADTLRPVLADPASLLTWFTAPKERLYGLTPAEWLSEGRDEKRLAEIADEDASRLGPVG
jgi:hypothetical protein